MFTMNFLQEDGSVCKLESACGMTVTVMCPNKPDRLLNQVRCRILRAKDRQALEKLLATFTSI